MRLARARGRAHTHAQTHLVAQHLHHRVQENAQVQLAQALHRWQVRGCATCAGLGAEFTKHMHARTRHRHTHKLQHNTRTSTRAHQRHGRRRLAALVRRRVVAEHGGRGRRRRPVARVQQPKVAAHVRRKGRRGGGQAVVGLRTWGSSTRAPGQCVITNNSLVCGGEGAATRSCCASPLPQDLCTHTTQHPAPPT